MATHLLQHLCLLSSVLAAVATAANTAPNTTATTNTCPTYRCGHAVEIRYPFWVSTGGANGSSQCQCGYPSLRLECRGGTPILPLPSGEYVVTRITYGDDSAGDRTVSVFDLAVSANRSCPLVSGRNLTLPPGSPPPLSLTHRNTNLTFYTNCTFKTTPSLIVPCLESADGRHHTYVFRDDDHRVPSSYSSLCDGIVGMPVLRRWMVSSTGPLDSVMPALKRGFELRWRPAVGGECGVCEKAGGSCGQRRDARGSWGFTCLTPESRSSSSASRRTTLWIVASIIPVTVLLLCILVWIIKRKRGKASIATMTSEMEKVLELWKIEESNTGFSIYNFDQIAKATGDFSSENKLGQGGFGPVYKGTLIGGLEIAIKRLSASSSQGLTEFKNEVQLIAKLQHRNLVKLLGCCVNGDDMMLIYEFLNNRSLDVFIFDSVKGALLNWGLRLHIINGIAQGLLYLHRYSRLRVVHRDLKASNVLLDEDMNPKISDFGLARIFPSNVTEVNTANIVGTPGYIAPEYANEGHFSTKLDVYSFGLLLLEIVSGRKNGSFYRHGRFYNLSGYAYQLWRELKWYEMVDSVLGPDYEVREVVKCIQVALLCVQASADDRPSMGEVVSMLATDGLTLPEPKEPAYFHVTMSSIVESTSSSLIAETSHVTNEELSGGR